MKKITVIVLLFALSSLFLSGCSDEYKEPKRRSEVINTKIIFNGEAVDVTEIGVSNQYPFIEERETMEEIDNRTRNSTTGTRYILKVTVTEDTVQKEADDSFGRMVQATVTRVTVDKVFFQGSALNIQEGDTLEFIDFYRYISDRQPEMKLIIDFGCNLFRNSYTYIVYGHYVESMDWFIANTYDGLYEISNVDEFREFRERLGMRNGTYYYEIRKDVLKKYASD